MLTVQLSTFHGWGRHRLGTAPLVFRVCMFC